MAVGLMPTNEHVLVRLGDSYEHIKIATKVYEAKSQGVVEKVSSGLIGEFDYLVGKRVYWQEEVAGAPITRDNVDYAFVHIQDIQGYDNAK